MDQEEIPKPFIKKDYRRRRTDGVAYDAIGERFQNREWAKRIVFMLLEIEQDAILRMTVENIIVAIAAQARARNNELKNKLTVIK